MHTFTHFLCCALIFAIPLNCNPDLNLDNFQDFGLTYDSTGIIESFFIQASSYSNFLDGDISDNCQLRSNFKGPDYFMFWPDLKGILKNVGDSIEFVNTCFQKNILTLIEMSNNSITFAFSANDAQTYLCKDVYLFTTSRIHHVKLVFFRGNRTVILTGVTKESFEEIKFSGIRVFSLCRSIPETLMSLYKTYTMLTSPAPHVTREKVTREKELHNLDFLRRYSNYTVVDRGNWSDFVLPIEDQIHSGDFIGLAQFFDFEGLVFFYMSGSRISHATIALRLDDGKLYIAESNFDGIKISPWNEFLQKAIESMHSIVHLPLKEEFRKKFDTKKAYEFFKTVEGHPYGTRNMFFSWLDLAHGNLPDYLPTETFLFVLSLLEKYNRTIIDKFFGEALNMRLGTKNLAIPEVTLEAARRGMTFEEVMALPEENEWVYSNGNNLVCSTFVVEMYRQGGVFDDLKILSNEFTPKDVYGLSIFDKEYKRPQICIDADPNLPYCHIVGKYRIQIDNYATTVPYNYMNTRCPTIPPSYVRHDGC